jgi:hypothetical protein
MNTKTQIDGFLAKYTPEIARQLREARKHLQGYLPRGYELVFENYNALVFGYSPNEKSTGAIISVAGYPKWTTLFFLHGTQLDDPDGVLEGAGKTVRSVRLQPFERLASPAVHTLLLQAIALAEGAFDAAPPLSTVVKTVVAKQRPRRPAGQ